MASIHSESLQTDGGYHHGNDRGNSSEDLWYRGYQTSDSRIGTAISSDTGDAIPPPPPLGGAYELSNVPSAGGPSIHTTTDSLRGLVPEKKPSEQTQQQPQRGKKQSIPLPKGPEKYFVLLGSFCALFASFGWRTASGLFQVYYQSNQLKDESPSAVAWINSAGFSLMYFGAIFVQPLNDKFGTRPVLLAGSLIHVAGLLATSWCQSFWQFLLAQGILSPLGASALFFSSIALMGNWWYGHMGTAVGITAAGISAGGVTFPLMIERLLPQIGFAWTLRAVTLLILVLALVAFVTIRGPPVRKGYKPPPRPKGWDRFSALKQRRFVLALVGISLFANGYFLVLVFVASVAGLRGWDNLIEAIVILNGASFFGRILPGFLADKVGQFNVMIFLALISTILIFGLWIPGNNVPASIAFSAVFGFMSGSTISLGPGIILQISPLPRKLPNMVLLYLAEAIAALGVSPIGGALLSAGGNTNPLWLQIFAGAMTAVGSVLIILSRIDHSKSLLEKI